MSLFVCILLAMAPDPGERLIRDAQAVSQATYPRTTHVKPALPGRFGDSLGERLMALEPALQTFNSLPDAMKSICTAAAAGLMRLPDDCRELVVAQRENLHAILAQTHASEAGLPPGLRTLSDPHHPLQKDGFRLLTFAAELATYELTLQLEQKQVRAAVETCLDAAALGRDVMYGGGLLGMSVGGNLETLVVAPCAWALDLAPREEKRRALEQLRQIRRALPPLSDALRQEQVYVSLTAFGGLLDGSERRLLPSEAQPLVVLGRRRFTFIERALLRACQRDYLAYMDGLSGVANLSPAKRAVQFSLAREKLTRSLNPFTKIASPDFEVFAKRRDLAPAALDLLIEATRMDVGYAGDWPAPANPARVTVTMLADQRVRLSVQQSGRELAVEMTPDRVPLEALGR
jgi:hypothetical protein